MNATSEETKECVICYEALQSTNLCVPPCGHEFCFKCMMQHVQRNNGCPCCRATLIEDLEENDEEEEDEEDEEEEDDEEAEEDGEEEDYDEDEYPIEQLVDAFAAKGYGLKDALSLLMYKFSKTDEKYTKQYIRQLEDDIDNMNYELGKEHEEQASMAEEDTNAFA